MSIPITYSEDLYYRIQYSIDSQLEKVTKQTEWIRLSALIAMGISCFPYLITRITSVIELTFKGVGLLIYSSPSSEFSLRGRVMLKRIPEKLGNIFAILPGMLFNTGFIILYPKGYIARNSVHLKVCLPHLKAGTVGTKEYDKDLEYALGKLKEGD